MLIQQPVNQTAP